jgi:predicted PurR-regulated permease PerM
VTLLGRRILVGLALLAVGLVAYLAYPFASALLVAAVLAAALAPWCERIAVRLEGRRRLAAALVTTMVTLLLAVPVVGLALTFAQQSVEAVAEVRTTLQNEGVAGVVDDLPVPLRDAARQVIARLPRREKQVEELAGDQTGRMAGVVGYVLLATWSGSTSSLKSASSSGLRASKKPRRPFGRPTGRRTCSWRPSPTNSATRSLR